MILGQPVMCVKRIILCQCKTLKIYHYNDGFVNCSLEANHVVQVSYVHKRRCANETYTKASKMTTLLVMDECDLEMQ